MIPRIKNDHYTVVALKNSQEINPRFIHHENIVYLNDERQIKDETLISADRLRGLHYLMFVWLTNCEEEDRCRMLNIIVLRARVTSEA